MKFWENISTQEQRTLKYGLIAVMVLIVLRFVWWPLLTSVNRLQADIASEGDLITWMKPTVDLLKNTKEPLNPIDHRVPRLSTIEKSFAQAGLSTYVKNLSQNPNQEIVLQAKMIPFSALAQCLESLAKQYGIVPLSLSAVRQETGIVDAEIVF